MRNPALAHPRLVRRPLPTSFDDEVTSPQTPRAKVKRLDVIDLTRQPITSGEIAVSPRPSVERTAVIAVRKTSRIRALLDRLWRWIHLRFPDRGYLHRPHGVRISDA